MKRNINRNQSHPNIIKCQASSFLKGGHQNENLVEKEAKKGKSGIYGNFTTCNIFEDLVFYEALTTNICKICVTKL